jgi:hypothetical protein
MCVQDIYGSNRISFLISAFYIAPQLPMLFVMASPVGRLVSFTPRIVSMLVLQMVLMLLLPALAHFSMYCTLAIIFGVGLSTAILQSSVIGVTR